MIYNILMAILQAFLSTVCSVGCGILIVHFLQYTSKKMQLLYGCVSLFCMVMPTKVCALSVQLVCGNGLSSIIIAHMIMNIPFVDSVLFSHTCPAGSSETGQRRPREIRSGRLLDLQRPGSRNRQSQTNRPAAAGCVQVSSVTVLQRI